MCHDGADFQSEKSVGLGVRSRLHLLALPGQSADPGSRAYSAGYKGGRAAFRVLGGRATSSSG